jgi:hypothetical protein
VNSRRVVGVLVLTTSILVLAGYTYLMFFARAEVQQFVVKATVYLFVVFLIMLFIAVGFGLLKSPLIPPRGDDVESPKCVDHEKL